IVHDHGDALALAGFELGADRGRLPGSEKPGEDLDRDRHQPLRFRTASASSARAFSWFWLPSARKLSSITPMIAVLPSATWPAMSLTTSGWRVWSLPLFAWLQSIIRRPGSPALSRSATTRATSSEL